MFLRTALLSLLLTESWTCRSQEQHPISVRVITSRDPNCDTLYYLADNRVSVKGLRAGDRIDFGSTTLRAKGDTIIWYNYLTAPRKLDLDSLRITRGRALIYQKRFAVARAPRPVAFLGNVTGKSASVSEILANPCILIKYPGTSYQGNNFTVYSFETIRYMKNGFLNAVSDRGYQLSPESVELIRGMQRGERLLIANIRVTCPDCTMRILDNIEVFIR